MGEPERAGEGRNGRQLRVLERNDDLRLQQPGRLRRKQPCRRIRRPNPNAQFVNGALGAVDGVGLVASSRGNFHGPGNIATVNMALYKTIPLFGSARLRLGAQVINLTNSRASRLGAGLAPMAARAQPPASRATSSRARRSSSTRRSSAAAWASCRTSASSSSRRASTSETVAGLSSGEVLRGASPVR